MPNNRAETGEIDHARREFIGTLQRAAVLSVPFVLGAANAEAQAVSPTDLGWFNVRDYGALADGDAGTSPSTNAVAFQAAIDAVPTQMGGVVYVPAGLYRINQTLILRRNVCLVGIAMRLSRIYQEDNNLDIVTYNLGQPRLATSFLSNLTLSHVSSSAGSCLRTDKVDLVFCDRVQFRNGFRGCWIEDSINSFLHGCIANQQTRAGFHMRLNQSTLLSHCHATEQVGSGAGFSIDACRGTSLVNCSATNTLGGPGFYIANRYNTIDRSCTLSGCTASGNGMASEANGFEIVSTGHVALTGCMSFRNSGNGIFLGYGAQWITINGSQILNNGRTGVVLNNSQDVVIAGCVISDTQAVPTQRVGIHEQGNAERTIVTGNIVRGNRDSQIALGGAQSLASANIEF